MGRGGEGGGVPFTAHDLGFAGDAETGWTKRVAGESWAFRPLRRLADLTAVDDLQREVLGASEHDVIPASELVVVPETGGEVLGAFPPGAEAPVGALVGWGGFVAGRPRIVSDFLAVRAPYRNLGVGAELKRLQAAHALTAGFREIVWTVDPLRAANARLNFEKLGATARHYEVDRYGASYGAGLYGGLPTDRLHVHWAIDTARVRDRLLGRREATSEDDRADLPRYVSGTRMERALVPLPADVDRLLAEAPAAAREWRLALREWLVAAFAERFAIVGFVPRPNLPGVEAALVIERQERGSA